MKKKILIFIFIFLFSLLFINVGNVMAASIGTIKYTYSRNILKDMTYTYTESNNGNPQRAYVLQYNPKTTGVDCMAVFGEELFGGDKISHNIQLAKSQGYNVVAGVNASPFDTSNGVTVGTTIQNKRLVVTTSGPLSTNYDNFAILEDGSAYIGHPNFDLKFNVNGGSDIDITYLNRQKKAENNYVYLISRDFASDTKTLANSCEAVLTITKGDLLVNSTIECTVDSVNNSTTRTKVESGKLVLVGPSLASLGNLKANDKINIKIKDNDNSFDWSKVTQTISGFYQILGTNSYTGNDCKQALYSRGDRNDRHPRTTLGYKKNGEVVVYVADGRQPGVAVGMTDLECAEYMESLGCIAAIRMDGGGSSNLGIRLPGDDFVTTVNVPSDGYERSDADAFLFVLKKDYNTTVDSSLLLHAYPNDLKLLENTVTSITVKATDNNYNKKDCPEYTMTTQNGVGEIIDGNKFKARSGNGSGTITITSGSVTTTVNVTVTNTVDELYASVNNLALSPNEKVSLSVKAYCDSNLLICSNEAFKWQCDSEIGTIDKSGNFTATADAGKNGHITVSYGKLSAKVNVSIGQLPIEISGFETDKEGAWKNTQIGGGSGSCTINTDLKYVRYGEKSLKINFNLANTTGTVGTQIGKSSNVSITGTPTAIGMWVYGTPESQGAWIRLQYAQSGSSGALYADFGHIDWQGWKYLEAPIDTTVTYPISVKYLVRIMAVAESERLDGSIYVDGLRAVYGFTNDDIILPKIENIIPNGVTNSNQQTISFDMIDLESGINKDKTIFKLDGKLIENLIIKDIADGFNVSFTPSALIPLNNGTHTVNIRVEDNAGNFVIKDFSIVVDNSIPKMNANIDDKILRVGDISTYTISTTTTNFNKLYLTIQTTNLSVDDIVLSASYQKNIVSQDDNTLVLEITNNGASATDILNIKFKAASQGQGTAIINGYFTNANYADLRINLDEFKYEVDISDNLESILEFIKSNIDDFFD